MDSEARKAWEEWFTLARKEGLSVAMPEVPSEAYEQARYDRVCGILPKARGTSGSSC